MLAGMIAVLGLAASAASGRAKTGHPCLNTVSIFRQSGPTPVSEPFDPAVTGMFAVLRRSSGVEDQIPPINPLAEDLGYQLRSYYPAEIRQLARDADGERYFLIPGYKRGFAIPPAKCLPKGLRHLRARFVEEQHQREIQPNYCLEDIGPHRSSYFGANCLPFSAIQTGEDLLGASASRTDVIELAPDGVATVRLTYRSGDVVNAAVSGNVYSLTPPQAPIRQALKELRPLEIHRAHLTERQREARTRALFRRAEQLFVRLVPQTVGWIDATGATIRSFSPPAHAAGGIGALFSLLLEGSATSVEAGFIGASG
jgi:hypothetical protein